MLLYLYVYNTVADCTLALQLRHGFGKEEK